MYLQLFSASEDKHSKFVPEYATYALSFAVGVKVIYVDSLVYISVNKFD